jgi:hypothetical protein
VSAWCTVAGAAASWGSIQMPRVGVWVANLVLEVEAAPQGRVELVLAGGALRLVGTVARGNTGVVRGAAHVQVVGGAGGLRSTLPAAGYHNVPLSVPLRALLSDAGEELAPDADTAALATFLPRWARLASAAARSMEALAGRVGLPWRVLPSGAVWLGAERWRPAAGEYEVLEEEPLRRAVWLASDSPSVLPGQALLRRPVAHVAHTFNAQSLRTCVTFEETR